MDDGGEEFRLDQLVDGAFYAHMYHSHLLTACPHVRYNCADADKPPSFASFAER